MNKSVEIKPFWVVEADSLHEFKWLKSHFNDAGIKVNYKELDIESYYHVALFWVGKLTKEVKNEIKRLENNG